MHGHPATPALGGLLEGTLRFRWGRSTGEFDGPASEFGVALWEGNAEGVP
jgi:hypothetical protein